MTIDTGIAPLVDALSRIRRVKTVGSCEGHSVGHFSCTYVTFRSSCPASIALVSACIHPDYEGRKGDERWELTVSVGDWCKEKMTIFYCLSWDGGGIAERRRIRRLAKRIIRVGTEMGLLKSR